jgi:serine/threonine protein kinase
MDVRIWVMDKYKFVRKLGAGSFGSVDLVVDKESKQPFALKRVKPGPSSRREFEILAELDHPFVIHLREHFQAGEALVLVLEYTERSLYQLVQDHMAAGRALEEGTLRTVAFELAQALAYLHSRSLLHRDLKP